MKSSPEAQEALLQLRELKESGRFKDEFPSFASFLKFVVQHDMKMTDLTSE